MADPAGLLHKDEPTVDAAARPSPPRCERKSRTFLTSTKFIVELTDIRY
jgi:hypothetical protein